MAGALKRLPRITEEFSLGCLSYLQVRMLVRVATCETEQTLVQIAKHSTVNQLSLVVGRYRALLESDAAGRARLRGRCLSTWFDADGFFVLRGRLCPEDGAVVDAALRKAMSSVETSSPLEADSDKPPGHVYDHHGALQADALVQVARQSLCPGSYETDRPALPEVIVHVDFDAAAGGFGKDCHLDCGFPLAPETALRLSCDAALVPLIEDGQGNPLSLGRRTRSISTGLRRALSARDGGCRFPGCSNKRFLQGHHIKHWIKEDPTSLENLMELCSYHHRLVHEGGYSVKRSADGFQFFLRDGTEVPGVRPQKEYSSDLHFPNGRRIATAPKAICSEWLGDPVKPGLRHRCTLLMWARNVRALARSVHDS